jgi:hypothetical protein
MEKPMSIDGNLNALNKQESKIEKNEAIYKDEIERMQNELQPTIDELIVNFGLFASYSGIDRSELRAILLEDIAEQI